MSLIEKWKKDYPKGMDLRILLRVEQDLCKAIDKRKDDLWKNKNRIEKKLKMGNYGVTKDLAKNTLNAIDVRNDELSNIKDILLGEEPS